MVPSACFLSFAGWFYQPHFLDPNRPPNTMFSVTVHPSRKVNNVLVTCSRKYLWDPGGRDVKRHKEMRHWYGDGGGEGRNNIARGGVKGGRGVL